MDVAVLIRDVNATNHAVEDQCLRARRLPIPAIRSVQAAKEAASAAEEAAVADQTIEAQRPRRRAPIRGRCSALLTVALDGVACYSAAQALDGSQVATSIWTALSLPS